jgi:gluconate 2-dehydrogenase gamma chain
MFVRPPFAKGMKQQGPQSADTPAELYRTALAALNRYCRSLPSSKIWIEPPPEQQDDILRAWKAAPSSSRAWMERVSSKPCW